MVLFVIPTAVELSITVVLAYISINPILVNVVLSTSTYLPLTKRPIHFYYYAGNITFLMMADAINTAPLRISVFFELV